MLKIVSLSSAPFIYGSCDGFGIAEIGGGTIGK
jgi:hypothetical protein